MKFEEKIRKLPAQEVWEEYCSFLELSLNEYMQVQYRLLNEQIQSMAKCGLGKRFFGETAPKNVDEFRRRVPLTTYSDYADILLFKREDMLPAPPVLWLSTTWEGGDAPSKCAPYTQAMLDTYRTNILGAMLLSTSCGKGHFRVRPNAKVLYSLAPLPYATGLFPGLVAPEIRIKFLPALEQAKKLSFSQRCKEGFKLSIMQGMDQFYGMTSIVYSMSKDFPLSGGKGGFSLKEIFKCSPKMLFRLLKARYRSKRDGTPVRPGDIFHLEGFVCVGTDTAMYKEELEKLWGCRPLEVAGGTETCLLGTETWNKNGLVFYPDNCFYEFIPEQEMLRGMREPGYIPQTYLMDELTAGEKYEIVITSLKGGAFMRYRVGDIYRCLRVKNQQEGLFLPQFEYVDRIPDVIDIDGFTRITRREIEKVIDLSRLPIRDWLALKEYNDENRSYMHLYVEMDPAEQRNAALSAEILKEHLSIYFRYYDSDYADLKRMLKVDPLRVTILRTGSIAAFEERNGSLERINASRQRVVDFLRFCRDAGIGRYSPHE